MQVLKSLQDSVKQIEQMYADYEDLGLLIEMSQEEQDEETVQEIEEELLRFEGEFEELRIQTLLTGEYDRDHAIVTLHAGAGGTESCDWARMLTDICALKKGCTDWSEFLRLMRQESGRLLLHPVM